MTEPLWKGPLIDGISQSMLTDFNQCPYRAYIKLILGLKDSSALHPNLIWGDCLHKGLEHYIVSRDINPSIVTMLEYLAAKYPNAPPTYSTSLARSLRNYRLPPACSWKTEIVFDQLHSIEGHNVRLRGKLDGLCLDHPAYGSCMIEHKTKGWIDPLQTHSELKQDFQLNFYMQLHQVDWVIYDLILIPESQKYLPARSYKETPQEWMERLFTGPCGNYNLFPVNMNKGLWQHQAPKYLPPEDRSAYWEYTIMPMITKMCLWYDYVMQYFPKLPPPSPLFYKVPPRMFDGSYTEKFQCSYYTHLLGETELEDLVPIKSLFSELEEL